MATLDWMNTSRNDVVASLAFSEPKVTSNGIKIQYLAYKNQKLIIQTPKMYAPFGINNQYKSEDKFEITLRFEENNAVHQQFQRMLKAIEAHVIQYIFEHQAILGVTGRSYEVVADKLSSCIKENKYGKSIVPKVDGKFKGSIYDGNKVQTNEVTKQSFNHVFMEIPSLWITSGRFGLSLKCIQIQTFKCVEKKINSLAITDFGE